MNKISGVLGFRCTRMSCVAHVSKMTPIGISVVLVSRIFGEDPRYFTFRVVEQLYQCSEQMGVFG